MLILHNTKGCADAVVKALVDNPLVVKEGPLAISNLVMEVIQENLTKWEGKMYHTIYVNGQSYTLPDKVCDYIVEQRTQIKQLQDYVNSMTREANKS